MSTISLWPFHEGAGTVVADVINGHDGTVVGATWQGIVTNATVGTSAGSATVAAVSETFAGGAGLSQGHATVEGIGGEAVINAVGLSQGQATVTGVGSSAADEGAGTSQGQATVSGEGAPVASAEGLAQGQATVSGVGADPVSPAVGESAGSATVLAFGRRTVARAGTSNGVATVIGIAPTQETQESDGLSRGQATVLGASETALRLTTTEILELPVDYQLAGKPPGRPGRPFRQGKKQITMEIPRKISRGRKVA